MSSTEVAFTATGSPADIQTATIPDGEFYADWIAHSRGVNTGDVTILGTEFIVCTVHNDGWLCPCGNDESSGGFAFVTADGVEVAEPNEKSGWVRPLYGCNECGRIGDQDTLTTNPTPANEYETHRVVVVRGPGPLRLFRD